MAEQPAADKVAGAAIVVLDREQNVLAANSAWRALADGAGEPAGSFAAGAGQIPGLAEWIAKSEGEEAQAEFQSGKGAVTARLVRLQGEQPHRLLIIENRPATAASAGQAESGTEEDAYGRLRHDIKNRIGGLKLYTTFLKRKLGDQADLLDVVGKMLNSLDQMTVEVNKIRRLEGEIK